jgi:hypothetical protein
MASPFSPKEEEEMKLIKKLTVLGFACLLVMACTEKQPATIGQTDQTDLEKKPAPMAQVGQSDAENQPASMEKVEQTETQALSQTVASAPTESAEIAGALMQTEKGLAIVTGTDTYIVAGQDLSDMIGKTIKVTGTVAEVDGGQVIEVITVTPIE